MSASNSFGTPWQGPISSACRTYSTSPTAAGLLFLRSASAVESSRSHPAPAPPVTTAIPSTRGILCGGHSSGVYVQVVAEVEADRLQDRKAVGTVNTSTAPSTPVYFWM